MYSNSIKTDRGGKTPQTVQTSRNGSDLKPETWILKPSAGTLYLCVISAPNAEIRNEVARHLQYWPYVKFFKYQGDRHLLCCFCLGEANDGWQLKQLYERSRQLVLLCLRQYDVTITHWKPLPADFKLYNNHKLVIRTDDTLKPFITFMGESMSGDAVNRDRIAQEKARMLSQARSSNREPTLIIPHPASLSSGRHVVPPLGRRTLATNGTQECLSKIYKKISQCILSIF